MDTRSRDRSGEVRRIMARSPVIPVLTIENADHAVPLARALVVGGIDVLEITLRSEAAFEALRRVRAEVPEMLAGIGTATTLAHLERAKELDAAFAVSPGLTLDLVRRAAALDLPFLPGVATASEVMAAHAEGLDALKFFPAEPMGGVRTLAALAPVFPEISFCPTGGVTLDNLNSYLQLPNVTCVGGSWLTPKGRIDARDWSTVTARAAAAIDRARSSA